MTLNGILAVIFVISAKSVGLAFGAHCVKVVDDKLIPKLSATEM